MIKIKHAILIVAAALVFAASCTTSKKMAYLYNLPETGGEGFFPIQIPEYKIQHRDILYITARAMTPDGFVDDFLSQTRQYGSGTYMQGEAGQFLFGYDVNSEGRVIIPAVGEIEVMGLTLEEARNVIQQTVNTVYKNSTVECKLLSFKFTVIGEVRSPGAYFNYNNYLTVLEAIGRAGGVNDFGRRDRLLVIRPVQGGTKTYTLNLQDKSILSSEAYFLLPYDVVIVEPESKKVFNLNLPTYTFVLTTITSAITTTLLLVNYFKR